MRAGLLGVVLGGWAWAWAGAGSPPPEATRPDLLLISVDTLRPDALGWVAGRNPTPAVDSLAEGGVRFPAAVSPVPLTLPAHVSLMTGLLPRRHGVRDNGQVLGAGPTTLAEVLRAKGYVTAAFIGGYTLRAPFGLDRGFEHYDDELPGGDDAWRERPALETTAAVLGWLRALHGPSRARRPPVFVFVHYYDPHDPYTPPARLTRPGPRGAYDGEVRAVDEAIGQLRRGLREMGAERNLLTVFTADHGESLGEHGEETHGFFVYDSTVLVPLVFHFPRRLEPAESGLPARLQDIAPTVLDLLGLGGSLGSVDGISLAPALRGDRHGLPPAYVESQQPWLGYGWAALAAVRAEGFKLIAAPRPELFDLRSDPQERSDLFDRKPEVARRLLAELRRIEGAAPPLDRPGPDPETLEALRALGYSGAAARVTASPAAALADPKDRLAEKRALAEAERLMLRRDHAGALARLDAVLAVEPDNRLALLRSGAALVALGRPGDAIPRLERLVKIDPDHGEARYELADALTRAGDRPRAITEWREALRLQPRRAVAWSNLGAVLLQAGRAADAAAALERAHSLEPRNAVLAGNLGAVRYQLALTAAREGRAEEARRWLRDALAADPDLRRQAAQDARLAPLLPP